MYEKFAPSFDAATHSLHRSIEGGQPCILNGILPSYQRLHPGVSMLPSPRALAVDDTMKQLILLLPYDHPLRWGSFSAFDLVLYLLLC